MSSPICCGNASAPSAFAVLQPGPLPFKWVLKVLMGIADALCTALAANVVHMDLKTDNIMIDDVVLSATKPLPHW